MNPRKFLFTTGILLSMGAVAAMAAGWAVMSVQVRAGHVRTTPSFLGKVVATLSYGDPVQVQGAKGSWMLVDLSDVGNGWMHISSLTRKKIVLNPGDADVRQAAAGDEIALAGKGFNEQVEGEYKARNPAADYAGIDKMEAIIISRKEMLDFLKEGELRPKGGAS